MYEQASRLKQLVKKMHSTKGTNELKVYSVTSGKGGVGKTNISVNISIALQNLGKKVLLVDADLGLANIDVVTGLNPNYNMSHILYHGKSIKDVMVEGPKGIMILPGASGLYDLANIKTAELEYLLNVFKGISDDFDVVIIDTGAGISKNVLSFVKSSDEAIIITTPEPTAVTDAYALIKIIYKHVEKVHLIVNRAENFKEAEATMHKILRVSRKFLCFDISYLGYVLEDKIVYKSNMEQVPFYINYPNGLASKCITIIGEQLAYGEHAIQNNCKTIDIWFNKLMSFIRK